MYNKTLRDFIILFSVLVPFLVSAQNPAVKPAENKEWVAVSNSYTQKLLDIDERYSPEFGSEQGLPFYDTLVAVPTLANKKAERKDKEEVLVLFKDAKRKETNLKVNQDLDILIHQLELNFRQEDYDFNKEVTFFNPTSIVFDGIKVLLDEQTPVERQYSSVSRLRKYAGLQSGYSPVTTILQERTITQMSKPDMIYPSRQEMEVILSRNVNMVNGIQELFIKYKMTGWEQPYATLKKQLED